MRLRELFDGIEHTLTGDGSLEVKGIKSDSRRVRDGELFVALSGEHVDGKSFVEDAIDRGAIAVLSEGPAHSEVAWVEVQDVREVLGPVASRLYGEPSEKMKLVGVTGTNGKTTVAYLVESILKEAGFNTGVLGTISYRYGDKVQSAPYTTPMADELQRLLGDMVACGTTHSILEVSSHALDQKRVDGCRFDVKVFTNLTPEHLDYHGNMEAYFESKMRLFTDAGFDVAAGGVSVINVDDEWGARLCDYLDKREKVLGYGLDKSAEVRTDDYSITLEGIEAVVDTPAGSLKVDSKLIGTHNLYNILAAATAGVGLGLSLEVVERGVNSLKCVPGRLERIEGGSSGVLAFVDYAHTADALERTLGVLNEITSGRIITVFGCGGDRDRAKRPIMGEVATRLSTIAIVTSDNPRDEDPLAIIADIELGLGGMRKFKDEDEVEGRGYMVVADRAEAVEKAASIAKAGDTLLVAGKGHEDYQIIKDRRIDFDDRRLLASVLERAGN